MSFRLSASCGPTYCESGCLKSPTVVLFSSFLLCSRSLLDAGWCRLILFLLPLLPPPPRAWLPAAGVRHADTSRNLQMAHNPLRVSWKTMSCFSFSAWHAVDPGAQIPFFSKQKAPSSTGFRRLVRMVAGLLLARRGWTGRSETSGRLQLRLCRPLNAGRWSESVLALQQPENITLCIQSEAAESQT